MAMELERVKDRHFVEPDKKADPSRYGEFLKGERERRGISLKEVSCVTKVRYAYLRALEDEDLSELPGPVYVRGYLSSYSRFLGLDEEEILKSYEKRHGDLARRNALDLSTFKAKTLGERISRFLGSVKRLLLGREDLPFF